MVNIRSFCTLCLICAGTRHSIRSIFGYTSKLKPITYILNSRALFDSKRNINASTVFNDKEYMRMDTRDLKEFLSSNRVNCENLLKRRFFYTNSFELYGGSAGFYDYGPPGCALKSELERLWREHFIVFDEMLEVSCSCITPYSVLKSSGHVDRFTDLMVKDLKTGECYRADKYVEDLLKNVIASKEKNDKNVVNKKLNELSIDELEKIIVRAGDYTQDEMRDFLVKNDIKSPEGNDLSEPFPFNLMFSTTIGPKKDSNALAYLRPETAQGIFVNFNRLLEYNGDRIPFAAAQIGLGFRNEISPRNGLLRVREFLMAEIEYFVNPKEKRHHKYNDFKHVILPLLPKSVQEQGLATVENFTVADAVENKIVDNEALGYFLARTYLFLLKCGINPNGIRFRQHTTNEMAHYASDCWDAEILTSYGWIETVGHADRMAYDLMCHSRATNSKIVASVRFDEPITVEKVVPKYNKALIGKTFKNKQQALFSFLDGLDNEALWKIKEGLDEKGMIIIDISSCGSPLVSEVTGDTCFTITRDMASFEKVQTRICEDTFTPAVIEPSFGIGRLIYAILEHSYRIRPIEQNMQEERHYVSLKPAIAPVKCCILPLSGKEIFNPFITQAQKRLNHLGISHKIDKSGAFIGKRYARTDEIGIPFAVTIDFQTVKDNTVTLRERDSMQQIRLNIDEAPDIIDKLLKEHETWELLKEKYPIFTQQDV